MSLRRLQLETGDQGTEERSVIDNSVGEEKVHTLLRYTARQSTKHVPGPFNMRRSAKLGLLN
jgi:hypothetical protein